MGGGVAATGLRVRIKGSKGDTFCLTFLPPLGASLLVLCPPAVGVRVRVLGRNDAPCHLGVERRLLATGLAVAFAIW